MSSAPKRFTEGLAVLKGADPAILGRPGTSVVAEASRAGTRQVACYQLVGHALLLCDPDVVASVAALEHEDVSLTDADFRSWASSVRGKILGQAVMKVIGDDGLQLVDPVGEVHRFDWSLSADVELMQRLVDASDEADLEAAEVAMDDLDARAIALLGDGGAIRAYASSRPFDADLPFGDIGILTTGGDRNRGWGRSAVSALVRDVLIPSGVDPLYRCDPENLGSHRLSAALGFETVAALTVAELPEA